MATPPTFNVSAPDPAFAEKAFAEYRDWYKGFVDHVSDQVSRAIDVMKQLSTFHERLLLISLGTIGLSVTALTSVASKLSGTNFPRHTFLWYVVPAWVCLLLSTVMSFGIMRQVVEISRILLEQWFQMTSQYSYHIGTTALTRLGQAVQGKVVIDNQEKDAKQHMFDMSAQLRELAQKQKFNKLEDVLKLAWGKDKTLTYYSGVAMLIFYAGMILLCISAVRLFLNL